MCYCYGWNRWAVAWYCERKPSFHSHEWRILEAKPKKVFRQELKLPCSKWFSYSWAIFHGIFAYSQVIVELHALIPVLNVAPVSYPRYSHRSNALVKAVDKHCETRCFHTIFISFENILNLSNVPALVARMRGATRSSLCALRREAQFSWTIIPCIKSIRQTAKALQSRFGLAPFCGL